MTLISKMYGGGLRPSDPRRFLIEAMVCAMWADGHVEKSELEILERNLQDHELFSGLPRMTTTELIEIANDAIDFAGGAMERVEAIGRGLSSRAHRMAAYAVACEICFADGETSEERIYLEKLRRSLQLEEDEAHALKEAARRGKGMVEVEDRTRAMRQTMPRFIEAMAIMAMADGVVTEEERTSMLGVLRTVGDMAVLTEDELGEAVDRAFSRINEESIDNEVNELAGKLRSPSDRYWATVYMMIIAIADGYQNWRHVWLLSNVMVAFDFSEEQMERAMQTAKQSPPAKKMILKALENPG
jgi:tellurite resistance protein